MNIIISKWRLIFLSLVVIVALTFTWAAQYILLFVMIVVTIFALPFAAYIGTEILFLLYPEQKKKKKIEVQASQLETPVVLSDDDEIMEIVDDEKRKRGADSTVE